MSLHLRAILALSLLFALPACASTGPDEPAEVEVVGVVEFHDEAVLIEVPDTVDAGVPFTVAVRTWGGGCVNEGPTRVSIDGSTVQVEPIDIEVQAEVCTSDLRSYMHTADVTLGSRGPAVVRIVGRRLPEDETVTLDRSLVVR